MAYSEVNSNLYDVGDPVKRELFNGLNENIKDHETRITAVEAAAGRMVVWNFPIQNATLSNTLTGLTYWTVPFDLTIIEATCGIFEKGSLTGTLEIDIKVNTSRNPTGMSSIFTTKPSIAFAGASDYDNSSNGVLNSLAELDEGNVIRFDATSMPSNGVLGAFVINVIGEI